MSHEAEERAEDKPTTPEPVAARRALELVTTRGRDVIGVRHVLEGGTAYVGSVSDSVARVPMTDYGGRPMAFAEATARRAVVHVPPRARARIHGEGRLPRLAVGPVDVEIGEGDKVVVVLGGLHVRARLVSVESFAQARGISRAALAWIAVLGVLYLTALGVATALAPAPVRLDHALQRAATHATASVAGR
ncbi:MAG TPA: hypothetical protein VHB21_12945 [Minicystis sp.]|nr:hypothetical protein [Minicystis sp.]